jgi:hypothetical protein
VDVVIGRIPAIAGSAERKPEPGAPIEAKVLHVRQPRRSRDPNKVKGGNQRQSSSAQVDPPGARVLVLLVPDAYKLPEDLMDGNHRIFLRIVKR